MFFFLISLLQLVKILPVATTWTDAIACLLFGEIAFPEANLTHEVNGLLDFFHEIIPEE